MALIDELEFCHCDLNRNLNELVRAAQGAQDVTVLGCSDMPPRTDGRRPSVMPRRRQHVSAHRRSPGKWL